MAQNLLRHFRGIKAYAFLIWVFVLLASFIISIIAWLGGIAGVSEAGNLRNVGFLISWFAVCYVAVGRFVTIEGRRPKLSDANAVGLWSIVTFFIVVGFFLLLALMGTIFTLMSGAEMGGGGRGGPPAEGADSEEPVNPAQALLPIIGFLGTLTWVYLVPMLSFLVFSLFHRPPSDDDVPRTLQGASH